VNRETARFIVSLKSNTPLISFFLLSRALNPPARLDKVPPRTKTQTR